MSLKPTVSLYLPNICKWAFGIIILMQTLLQAQPTLQYTIEDGLPTQHIYDVLEGPEGFIWLATNRGLVKFDGYEFTVFSHKDGLPNNDVWKMRMDAENRLWFFSKSNRQGYILNDSIHTFPTSDAKIISPNSVFAYPDGLTLSQQEDKFVNGKFVPNPDFEKFNLQYHQKNISVRDDSIKLTDANHKAIKTMVDKNIGGYSSIKIDYYPHEHYSMRGTSWTLFGNDKTNEIRVYPHSDFGIGKNKVVLVKFINNQYQISNGPNLIILNKNFDVVKHYKFDASIRNNYALKDSHGNMWFWGKKIGLKLMTKVQLETPQYLIGNKVNVIGQMDGQIVSASESDGYHFFNSHTNAFEQHPFIRTDFPNIPYHIIENDSAQYLITNKAGIAYSDNNGFREIKSMEHEIYRGGKDFLKVGQTDYWVTSAHLISNALKLNIHHKGLNDIESWKGDIILSSSEGLKVLKNNEIVPYLPQDSTLNFPTTRLVKGNNNLWIGTDGKGVFGYNQDGLKQLKATEDLIIKEIIEVEDVLWVATDNGVKKIQLTGDAEHASIINSFYKNDGLLQNIVNDIYLKKDTLWVATDNGISILNMHKPMNPMLTKLYFKGVGDSLVIKEQENRNLNIAFGARNFGNQENLQFSYRLLPSEEWVEINGRTISFNELEPNSYTLQLRAIDQHFTETRIALPIVVMPFWWESDWAFILFILASLLVLGIILYLIYHFYEKRKIIKIKQEKRVQALQLQALRSQMNPHFVHNSLNAIQYFIQMNDVEKSEEYLSKFSELIRLFFEFSRENLITLEQEIKLISRYIEIEKLRFEERLNYKIEIDPKLYVEEQMIPTMILQPLVENAINHGLFHKKERGHLLIKFDKFCDEGFKVIIQDDGIGIEKAKELFKKSVKNYKSNSSMVLDERLKLLNQSGEWKIDYHIASNSDGKNTGTTITITFKQ